MIVYKPGVNIIGYGKLSGVPLNILAIYKSKKDGKDQESIQSSTTSDPGYNMGSDKIAITYHKQEPRGQFFPSR